MKRLVLAATMVLCSASFAMADARFDAMDTDNNGTVSWEEFEAAMPQMRKPAFEAIDTDSDGAMTDAEWNAFLNRHGAGGKGMGEGQGMSGMTMPPKGMGSMGGMSDMGSDCEEGPNCTHKSSMPLIEAPKK
ncbi:MAG: EF-hand domain-containing protein [Pseudomonadota bacterium]